MTPFVETIERLISAPFKEMLRERDRANQLESDIAKLKYENENP